MKYFFFLLSYLCMTTAFAQKKEVRRINQVFSYEKIMYRPDRLWIAGNAQPMEVEQDGPFYKGYIWVKTKEKGWVLIDSLKNQLSDKSQFVVLVSACTNGKNFWVKANDQWSLYAYTGEKLTGNFDRFEKLNDQWYALLKDDQWQFGNEEGKTGSKRFAKYKAVNAKKNMLMVSQEGQRWSLYDCAADEVGKDHYLSFFSHDEYVLAEEEKQWVCIRVDKLGAAPTVIDGPPLIAGDTASGFFVRHKTGWNLYDYARPTTAISRYDSVVFNHNQQVSFGLKQNQWKRITTKGEETLCLKKNELPYLITPVSAVSLHHYQRAKVVSQVQRDFYSQGLNPDHYMAYELERSLKWYADPEIYFFNASTMVGLCNVDSNKVTALPLYTEIDVIAPCFYRAVYQNTTGLINKNGDVVIPFNYIDISEQWNTKGTGRILVGDLGNQQYDLYDEQARKMNEEPIASPIGFDGEGFLEKNCERYEWMVPATKKFPAEKYVFTWNEKTGRYTFEKTNLTQRP